jgi:hypothetical protein
VALVCVGYHTPCLEGFWFRGVRVWASGGSSALVFCEVVEFWAANSKAGADSPISNACLFVCTVSDQSHTITLVPQRGRLFASNYHVAGGGGVIAELLLLIHDSLQLIMTYY